MSIDDVVRPCGVKHGQLAGSSCPGEVVWRPLRRGLASAAPIVGYVPERCPQCGSSWQPPESEPPAPHKW